MIALIPMAVAVFASFILQERLLPFQWLSILASVGGVVLLTVPRMQESSGQLVGNLALLGAVVFNVLGMGRFTLRSDLPAYFQAFTNLDTAWAIVYLGLFSSVGAFFCMNYALPKLTPSKSAVFINLTQVISVLAGIFFRNEQFAPIQLLGVAIILAGVWGVNQGKKKAPANL